MFVDIYCWGAGLTVTGRIRDIGQNVLQCSLQTGSSSSSHSYCHVFFLIAFLEEAFVINTIILLCTNYMIIIYVYDNNVVIINNCGPLEDLGGSGGTVVKVMCYKSEGRSFDPVLCPKL